MSARRRTDRKSEDRRPVVTDDFIYDDPDLTGLEDADTAPASDTPEEAVRKLRRRTREDVPELSESEEASESVDAAEETSSSGRLFTPGVMLDEDLQTAAAPKKKTRRSHPVIRGFILVIITLSLLLSVTAFIFHRIYPKAPGLGLPESVIVLPFSEDENVTVVPRPFVPAYAIASRREIKPSAGLTTSEFVVTIVEAASL